MHKKSQVTIFILLGVIFVMLSLFFINMNKSTDKINQNFKISTETKPIKNYIENCLETSSEKAVWDLSSVGGYKGTNTVNYNNKNILIYTKIPAIQDIEKAIAKVTKDEFELCFDESVIESHGFKADSKDKKITASITDKNIIIELELPISLEKTGHKTEVSSFLTTIEVRLKDIHKKAVKLINKANSIEEPPYDIEEDCAIYDYNGLTNINIISKANNQIVQFVDFSTLNSKYAKSYKFRFALKDQLIQGECSG